MHASEPELGHQLCQGQGQSFVNKILETLIERKVEGQEKRKEHSGVKYRKVERKIKKVIPKDLWPKQQVLITNKILASHVLPVKFWRYDQDVESNIPKHSPFKGLKLKPNLLPLFFLSFYWSIVDLQCCVNFRCTAKWICYTCTHTHSFLDSFPI